MQTGGTLFSHCWSPRAQGFDICYQLSLFFVSTQCINILFHLCLGTICLEVTLPAVTGGPDYRVVWIRQGTIYGM